MSESYTFTVNGVSRTTHKEEPLLRYLRDELRLTSVKDGCSEGACGTCTILVDGRAVRSCILTTKKAAGKSIVTVEGLSPEEQEAFVYAFGAVGAVQCGFCIPGMVLSGKALLDVNPEWTRELAEKLSAVDEDGDPIEFDLLWNPEDMGFTASADPEQGFKELWEGMGLSQELDDWLDSHTRDNPEDPHA